MLDLLAKPNLGVLRQFADSEVLLAFDFDGTLAPIVADPEAARVRAGTAALLKRLCRLYPCAVISGRAVADVRPRLEGLGFLEITGNHGLEPAPPGARFAKTVSAWRPVLERRLAPFKGVVIEDKGYSVAVHYRKSREKPAVRRAIAEVASELQPLRLIGGHQVVNLLPPHAPHKGVALHEARERLACDTAIYVGDDDTDEDVFALGEPGRLLTVRVGHRPSSRAEFFLQRQGAIDELLAQLCWLRSRPHPKETRPHERQRSRARAAAPAG